MALISVSGAAGMVRTRHVHSHHNPAWMVGLNISVRSSEMNSWDRAVFTLGAVRQIGANH